LSAAVASPNPFEWRNLASLGEQLASADSLSAQQERILQMTHRLVDGRVSLWLDESLFRLPDRESVPLFTPEPPPGGLRRAWKTGQVAQSDKNKSGAHWVAIPIADQGMKMGALQIHRVKQFRPEELDILEGFSSIVAIGLYSSHRAAVERFRLGQLNLVRQVSAQIANVLDLDELARRVTDLIQKTFNYYYVAFFTLKPGARSLRFRASASAPRPGRRKKTIIVDAELGQGLIGQAANTGERILSDDVRQDSRYRFFNLLPETISEVSLPLRMEDRVLGVLDVQSNQPHAFHPNDLLVLETLADSIAQAVEGARLYGDLRRRADQLSLIAEVSKGATSSLDLPELMRSTAHLIHKRFGFPFVHMYSVHPNRRTIEFEAGSGKRSKHLQGFVFSLDDPQGIIPWVGRKGQTVLCNDVLQDERYRPSPLPPKNIRAELSVPLVFDGKVVGLLDIQTDRLNAFSEDDQLIFEAVADNIAAAIHNSDLYQTEQWRRRVGDSLREVAGLLSDNVGLDESLQAILDELSSNLPIDISAIWLLGGNDLYLAACSNCDINTLEKARYENPDASAALMASLLSPEPVIRKPNDARWPLGIAAGFGSDYSAIAAPLRIGDQPLGVIALSHHTSGRYGHEAQKMLSTFASYAAVAIENTRLYDQAQEQAYASAALLQVAQAVVSLNDLDEILSSIVRTMPILVGVRRIVLYHYDAGQDLYIPKQEYGFDEIDEPLFQRSLAPGEFLLLDSVCEKNQPAVRTMDVDSSPDTWFHLAPSTEEELAGIYASESPLLGVVPLSIKNVFYGAMVVEEEPGGLRFRSRRIEIINGIAQQAALAIQNDLLEKERVARERLETEVQLARQIQQTFIPEELPSHPNWQLSARWRTARQVGGDFYDVLELPDNRLGFFIADVADKGMPAALFMALTRTLVRAAARETYSPAMVLRRVNELLIPDTRQGMFVTAVYAILDKNTGEWCYANAGHNPPLWVRRDSVEKLTRTGIALGVIEDCQMTERTFTIAEGETIFLYTDGLTEAFNLEGDMFGNERLLQALGWQETSSADDLLSTIETTLDEFAGNAPPSDDLTMLAIRRVHPPRLETG
jgi:serine phosphatase RsbU (regulator of sigma subunit)/putative methionine-R-sulfoxide reductase with GAF domain